MSAGIAYFLKVNLALMLFYAFYRLFFRKDTFFRLRRSLLLACFGFALTYPLANVQEWMKEQEPVAGLIQMYSALLPATKPAENAAEAAGWQTNLGHLACACYCTGVALLLLRFAAQAGYILRLALRSRRMRIRGAKVYAPDKPLPPFSFFGLIFLQPEGHSEKETEEILIHERAHASGWHSVDVLIGECICIACWMNPFAWLLKREARYNLEYLADNSVLNSGSDSRSYQYHLLGLACRHHRQAAANLYNNFNVSHVKKRISMMNKKRSRAIERTKYLLFFPLAALLMLLGNVEVLARMHAPAANTGAQPQIPQDNKKKVYTVAEETPVFPGGEHELLKFINTNVRYPAEAKAKKVEGRVIVEFVVNEDGRISDVKIVRGLEPSLDAEAVRVIGLMSQPWTPGKENGQNVAVRYTVPITFRIR
jgi:TonB family protein